MGIAFVATGGVTLAGGVLPRIVDFLDESSFRQTFEAKAPVDGLARRIPTRLVTHADAVLVGMAAVAADRALRDRFCRARLGLKSAPPRFRRFFAASRVAARLAVNCAGRKQRDCVK